MQTTTENVRVVANNDGEAVALLRRDAVTRKTLVYLLADASVDQLGALIEGKKDLNDVSAI